MEPEIRDRFHDGILQDAMRRYAITEAQIEALPAFESFMYAFRGAGGDYILRLGHSRRRSPALIHGEVDWINYLAQGGAGVARAVRSARHRLVEAVDDGQGGQFLATAFARAPGGPVWEMGGWRDGLIEEYGRLLGQIHALSRHYVVRQADWRRPAWDDPIMLYGALMSPAETEILQRYQDLLTYLRRLPTPPDGYGMIHQDAHAGNLFVTADGHITLFDFDDCVYGHFVYDLAMVLFYALVNHPDADRFGPHFWRHFWRGYRREYRLDPAWLAKMPHFMKLREIDLYAIVLRDISPDQLEADSWTSAFMAGRRARLLGDVPVVTMSFPA